MSSHSALHLASTSLFVIQQCGVVAFCFGGYKFAKQFGYASRDWLLYGGIMSSIFLLIGVLDFLYGLMQLNFVSSSELYYGGILLGMGVAITMTVLTGKKIGETFFQYTDLTSDAAVKDMKSVRNWMKWGIGIGVTVSYIVAVFLFFMGSGHPFAAGMHNWMAARQFF